MHVTMDETKREWTVWDTHRNHRLMIVPAAGCFAPALNGVKAEAKVTRIAHDGKCITLQFEASGVSNAQVEWRVVGDGLEMASRFTTTGDCELNRLNLFPRGTKLNLDDLVNFRHRHHTCQTWPELNLGGKDARPTLIRPTGSCATSDDVPAAQGRLRICSSALSICPARSACTLRP